MKRGCTQLGTWMLLALALPAAQAATTAVVRGVVRDPKGTPQMGALVQLLTPDATAIASAITDLNGRYRIPNVAPGRYQMRASATLFLPTLRRNLRLLSGTQATVNLTLTTLIDAGLGLPARRRNPAEPDDDWKWTLRAAENRPVLRVLPDGTAVIEPERRSPAGHDGRVVSTAGIGRFGEGGIHSVALADVTAGAGSAAIFRTDIGAGGAPSVDLGSGYERSMGYAGNMRMAAVYQSRPGLTAGDATGLSSVALLNAQRMKMGDVLEVEVGSLIREVRGTGAEAASGSQVLPFVKVATEPVPGLMVAYRMATAQELQSFDDLDAPRMQTPAAVSSHGRMLMEGGRHQELSVTERVGAGTVQAGFYQDHLANPAIAGSGLPGTQAMASGDVMVDPVTETFRILGPSYDARGVTIAVSEPVLRSLWMTGEYDSGNALASDGAGGVRPEWMQAGMLAVSGKWEGGTQVRVAYRWQPNNSLTAVNQYRADAQGAYLSVSLRRPLRCGNMLPDGLEAVVDVSNLLAQGYRPVGVSADGGTLFLAQTVRAVQGGLAFTF